MVALVPICAGIGVIINCFIKEDLRRFEYKDKKAGQKAAATSGEPSEDESKSPDPAEPNNIQ